MKTEAVWTGRKYPNILSDNCKTALPRAEAKSPQGTSKRKRIMKYIQEQDPDIGEVTQIAPGVYWLRQALPFSGLNHINLYMIEDGDGWVIVDTGLGMKAAMDVWERAFDGVMHNRPVTKVVVTHLHPDHSGLAGWLCRRFDAPLYMSRGEYFLCRLMAADTGNPAPQEGIDFYRRAGFNEEQIEHYKAMFGGFGKAISPLPHSYHRLQDGDVLSIGGRDWHIVMGAGHSPEHACLWQKDADVFLSGDQILPHISSNVSVWPTEPDGDPLSEWIAACQKLEHMLNPETLICPAHGIPFRDGLKRLNHLSQKHERALSRVLDHFDTPKLATEAYPMLFRKKITDGNRGMAVGESLAHLNCLWHR
ncbi:MAG TPA: MBL fold metallo-hydrolase, partial [Hellea balneolensis]|nr:MBL fold metallo-hydrolase [Hellea balneolensis]